MPGGLGFSSAQGQSTTSSQGTTFVDPQQQPFLNFLRNMGFESFQGFQDSASMFGQQAQQFGSASAMAGGAQNPFLQSLFDQSQGNPELVAQQTGQLSEDLGRFFNEQLVPGLNSQGQQTGQFGGSRGQIGRGLAAQGVTDQLQRGAVGFQNADRANSLQAGSFGGQLFNQGQQNQLQGLNQGFQQMFGGFQSQFSPLFALSQIFGQPNNLSQQTAETQTSNSSFSVSGGLGV